MPTQPFITHSDPRLVPQEPLPRERWRLGPPTYRVTPTAMPELYADFKAIAAQMGAPHYELVLVDAEPNQMPAALADYRRKQVAINLHPYQGYTYDSVLGTLIGHELGHVWRRQHPQAAPIMPRLTSIKPQQQPESEADVLGVCLTGLQTATAAGIRYLNEITPPGETKRYALPESRALVVEAVEASDCPVMPATLPRRTAALKR